MDMVVMTMMMMTMMLMLMIMVTMISDYDEMVMLYEEPTELAGEKAGWDKAEIWLFVLNTETITINIKRGRRMHPKKRRCSSNSYIRR